MSSLRCIAWISFALAFYCSGAHWPQFRGPGGLGIADGPEPPTHFGPESNVLWKATLPPGNSSPVIWGHRLFLTAHDGTKIETLCLDAGTGTILWRRPAPAEKFEPAHKLSGPASSTPCTDGERLYSYFGSYGLLAYNMDGEEQWRVPLPQPLVEFGTGTSPITAGDLVIVQCDQDENSYLLAVNKRTGRTVWRTERPEFRRGFSTPFFWKHDGIEEIVAAGSIWLASYNLADGSERWRYSGTARVANATPVAGDGLLFSSSWNIGADAGSRISMEPFEAVAKDNDRDNDRKLTREELPAGPVRDRFSQMDLNKDGIVTPAEWQMMREMFERAENAVLAIRPGGKGNLPPSHLAWKSTRSLPYVSSPLFYQGRLYTVKSGGLFSCYDAKSGRPFYQDERLGAPGDYYSSAVAAGQKIFLASQQGIVSVFAPGDELNVLARNRMGEQVFATPAIVNGKLYLRTQLTLFAFDAEAD